MMGRPQESAWEIFLHDQRAWPQFTSDTGYVVKSLVIGARSQYSAARRAQPLAVPVIRVAGEQKRLRFREAPLAGQARTQQRLAVSLPAIGAGRFQIAELPHLERTWTRG
jgi:hypothetical protein